MALRERPTPAPGTIYRDCGRLLLYVRTEQRNGATEPEHLFVHTADRMVYSRWLSEVPPDAELIVDEGGRKQANDERWLRLAAEHDIDILAALLRQACRWLPAERANQLREEWKKRQP